MDNSIEEFERKYNTKVNAIISWNAADPDYLNDVILKFEPLFGNILNDLANEILLFEGNLNGYSHTGSNITSNSGNISLKSKKGISISGSELTAKAGIIDIEAQGPLDQTYTATATQGVGGQPKNFDASIIIDGTQDFYDKGNENDANYSFKTLVNPTVLNGFNGVNLRTVGTSAKDNLVLQATGIVSQNGNVKIESFKNILFDAAIEQSYDRRTTTQKRKSWGGLKKKYITTKTENDNIDAASVEIQAKNISIESKEINNPNNSIDIYSGKFNAEGNISIRSGGNINFYTTDNISISREDITKKSSFAGIKYNRSKTNSTRSQVSQIPATLKANYIGVKSGFDTRLIGTEFNYLSGAEIESGGKIFIAPAITRIEDVVKKEKNSVVWQSMQDKGSITETAQLPSFNGPTAPTFQADGGISVQIPVGEKDQNKVQIRDEILKLANQPGNEYLKDFVNRNDVDWNKVILAQQDWDYKSQGLTGAGAAIVVLIVTVLTSGAASGAASAISGLTSGTLGAGAGAALGAGAGAAVTSLATQVSISLINNGGDIGKTLKDLGSKESIRNLATSVVTASLLSQVSKALNLKPDSTLFSDRVYVNIVNSTGSAIVNTAIKGGSFAENFEAAILSGLVNAIQGELAQQIGDKLDIKDKNSLQYVVHKIAHAASGCIAGAIQKECLATAVGATMGEVIASIFPEAKNGYEYNDEEKLKISNAAKLAAGALAAFLGYDVNISANAADIAIKNNTLALKGEDKQKKVIINLLNANSESKIKFDYDDKGRIVPQGYHYDDSKNPPILVGSPTLNGSGIIDGTVVKAIKDANLIVLELVNNPDLMKMISIDDYKLGYVNTDSLGNPNNKVAISQLLHIITERLKTNPNYGEVNRIVTALSKKANEVNNIEKNYGKDSDIYKNSKAEYDKISDAVDRLIINKYYVPAHNLAIANEVEYVRQLFPDKVIVQPEAKANFNSPYVKNGKQIVTQVVDYGAVKLIIDYEYLGTKEGRILTGNVISSKYQ